MYLNKRCESFRSSGLALRRAIGSFLLIALVSSCSGIPRVDPVYGPDSVFDTEAKRVLIVSFDGLRPDAIEASDTPHIHSMESAGTFTKTARSVLPSITLVNHASMLSGVGPEKHGINWNDYIPDNGELTVPTVFDFAKRKGLKTAMVVGKEKFNHLNRSGTVDDFVIEEGSPYDVAKKAIGVLRRSRPDLMFVHLRHPDSEGHENGWMSPEQIEAIGEDDQALGHILNELKRENLISSTAVIVTADHGGSDHTHGSDSAIDTTIPWIAVGAEIPVRGPLSAAIRTFDTAATAADLLELEIPAEWDGKSAFGRD